MLFKSKMIEQIIAGKKTMTRRIVKEGEELIAWSETQDAVINSKGRLRFRVGQKRAVVSGRGKPQVWYSTKFPGLYETDYEKMKGFTIQENWQPLFIELVSIRKEKLKDITSTDALREGFTNQHQFNNSLT